MSIFFDIPENKQSAYAAYAMGLIDIIKHELNRYQNESLTLKRLLKLGAAETLFPLQGDNKIIENSGVTQHLKQVKADITNFNYRNPNLNLLEQLEKALQQINIRKKNHELKHAKFSPDSVLTDSKLSRKKYCLSIYQNVQDDLVTEFELKPSLKIQDLLIYQQFSSICWILIKNPNAKNLERKGSNSLLTEWIKTKLISRITKLRQWFYVDPSLIDSNTEMQKNPNYFTDIISRYIDEQISYLFLNDVFNNYQTTASSNEINPNSRIIQALNDDNKGTSANLKSLSHDLHIKFQLLTNKNAPPPNKIVEKPTITLTQMPKRHWFVHIPTNKTNITKFDHYFNDGVLTKREIIAIFKAYQKKSFGFFINHHASKAEYIINECQEPENEVQDIVNLLREYLDDKNTIWSRNSHFKEAAEYIIFKRSYFYNGATLNSAGSQSSSNKSSNEPSPYSSQIVA